LQAALKNIAELLEEAEKKAAVQDPLAAYWEKQIEAGEDPDLDLTLEDLEEMGEL
jgi:hypothetical protein